LKRAAKAMDLIKKMEDHGDVLVVDAHRIPKIEDELSPHEIVVEKRQSFRARTGRSQPASIHASSAVR
jgi:hypothetical protein